MFFMHPDEERASVLNEAKNCLIDKHIVFIGDSRIRQLFYSFIKLINPQVKEEGNKGSVAKPHIIVAGAATVSYTYMDPVYEDMLSDSRKMITNEKIDAYNEAAVRILNSSSRNSKAKVKLFSVSKLIAQETIMKSADGLHLPESSRDTNAMILMNVYCNKIMKPIDGSCCQPQPPLTLIQKLAFCFFTFSIIGYLIISLIHRNNFRKNKSCTDLESGEEKKPAISTPNVSTLEMLLHSFCKLGLIMTYFYLCDRANLFMKENKFYTHSSFFIPIVYILVLGVFYTENTKEVMLMLTSYF
ncbi:cas1 domain-containing protein 1 [Limosa lapponica baueri]|uniref:Cas1 domain-containing protein 1 n=1 Tax=Limosa lapponica baueri TaxID=1758121 RepID=A0A2I0THH8_LIMLA|nr:cas1 domain-containing protein 1 [Limosa lapponica baueri]